MNKKLKWTVEFEVDESWVADGFELNDEVAHDMLAHFLSYAYNSEIGAKVLSGPPLKEIWKLQGYTAAEMKRKLEERAHA